MRLAWVAVAFFGVAGLARANVAPSTTRRSPVVQAVDRVQKAVVSVSVEVMVSGARSPFEWFENFAPPSRKVEASQGSGVVIDPTGLVLTNYHVIAVGGDVSLELTDGRRLPAEVVGTAPDHDLAVLRVQAGKQSLPFVPMGTSGDLMIGETVIAIGNPFGLSHTVTVGVVSALHRSIQAEDRRYSDFIQTDASINPGNSGGPLLNIDGALVGINTAVYGRAQGIGFAIPIDKARRIVDDLVRYGEVRRPYFGFETQPLTPELAKSFGMDEPVGVIVAEVDPKGPAAERLREGDILVELDGRQVADPVDLRGRLGDLTAGTSVSLRVVRKGAPQVVQFTASVLSAEEALRRVQARVGITVMEMPEAEARRYRLPPGIILVDKVASGSAAGRVGLRSGDWVRAVDAEKVEGLSEFGKAMARSYWRGQVILLIQRGRAWQQIAFDL